MKHVTRSFGFAIAACLVLSACGGAGTTNVYSASAKAQGGADTLYIAAEKAGEALVATNVITKAQLGAAADKAYTALLAFRSAAAAVRAATNLGTDPAAAIAASAAALADFNAALASLQTLAGTPVVAATSL